MHDPIEPLAEPEVDAIFAEYLYDVRLAPREHPAAARVFAAALRPGGSLFLAPLHADSELDCLALERPLFDAGFATPCDEEEHAAHVERARRGVEVDARGAAAPKFVYRSYGGAFGKWGG